MPWTLLQVYENIIFFVNHWHYLGNDAYFGTSAAGLNLKHAPVSTLSPRSETELIGIHLYDGEFGSELQATAAFSALHWTKLRLPESMKNFDFSAIKYLSHGWTSTYLDKE
jgi:hypothetical protein